MNIKKSLFAAVLALGCMGASAQETKTVEVFKPHWYFQLQGGAQYTEGEIAFKDLISPNVQLSAGYNFTSVFGARFSVNTWQSKAGSVVGGDEYSWKWKYVAPMVDATVNLSNAIFGYNPTRVVNVGVFAGVGVNVAFDNDDAKNQASIMQEMNKNAKGEPVMTNPDQWLRHLWTGTTARLTGRVGANVDFRVSEKVSLGVEGNINMLSDTYNSKRATNPDFYYNVLAGVKINLGATSQMKTVEVPTTKVVEKIIERPVERVVERPVESAKVQEVKERLVREIFFPAIRSTTVPQNEMSKVEDIANYLKKYPEAKVVITGYADKATGNPTINRSYSEKRAKAVADMLKTKYGVDASRIVTEAKGDTEQPYPVNENNRVSICVAE